MGGSIGTSENRGGWRGAFNSLLYKVLGLMVVSSLIDPTEAFTLNYGVGTWEEGLIFTTIGLTAVRSVVGTRRASELKEPPSRILGSCPIPWNKERVQSVGNKPWVAHAIRIYKGETNIAQSEEQISAGGEGANKIRVPCISVEKGEKVKQKQGGQNGNVLST